MRKQTFRPSGRTLDLNWATSHPDKRRALAQLGVSDEITPETRATAQKAGAGLAGLVGRLRANGPLRDSSAAFAGAIMNSLAETTMDFMIQDPANAKKHCKVGFESFWRAVT